jgi:hypothetical protein
MDLLRVLVEAHGEVHSRTGDREPIMYLRHIGGASLNHHALPEELPRCDDTDLEELHAAGLISIDYREHNWDVVPTPEGRAIVEQHKRVEALVLPTAVDDLLQALRAQSEKSNKFGWSAVRPVLAALRDYWERDGFPEHGIAVSTLAAALPEVERALFTATINALLENAYLRSASPLRIGGVPAEVVLTERTYEVLDGWPGAAPEELVANLLAVLARAAESEADPVRRSKLERLAETVREVGVSMADEVLAKVMTGG